MSGKPESVPRRAKAADGTSKRTPSAPSMLIKAKVCLVGEAAVGKTSLARRFVIDQFDDRYIATVGAKVTKKEVLLPPEGTRAVFTIWDIMGEPEFRDLLKQGYFRGCNGVMAVSDVTRPDSIHALSEWVASVRRVSGPVPVIVLVNKVDLKAHQESEWALREHLRILPGNTWRTSAKTGANVEAAFLDLARSIARAALEGRDSMLPRPGRSPPEDEPETEEPESEEPGPESEEKRPRNEWD